MKITVVYNRVSDLGYGKPEDLIADDDTVIMAGKVAKELEKKGHKVSLLELDEETLPNLSKNLPDLFFNLCEGIGNLPHSSGIAAAALFRTGKPVVGSDKKAIELTTDKVATKKILQLNNLPTPNYIVVPNHQADTSGLKFPVIVKPAAEDCSLGISQNSVFKTKRGLVQKIKELLELYKDPVMIEEFIDGRELRVSIVGNGKNKIALPISELVFGKSFANKFKIFDFSAKWLPKSTSYEDTYAVAPANLSESLRHQIENISLLAFELTGCSDYGRVDIRLNKNNQPFVLEINANPAIGPADAFATSAKAAGISYGNLLEMIINA